MFSATDFARLQREQYRHDKRNHSDILCLSKNDRLKHYGLHFCKYAGRLARGKDDRIPFDRTIVDTFLVALSASNTLHQNLSVEPPEPLSVGRNVDPLYDLADAAGRFADACEKIDHLEEFLSIAREANRDVIAWVLAQSRNKNLELWKLTDCRRKELAERAFYIED